MCGEHVAPLSPFGPLIGSSPRVRGTLERLDGVHDGLGIIPACAGNTRRTARATISSRDHPRVCGEHAALFMVCSTCMGSSPRVRGTLLWYTKSCLCTGIIPACAGNTRGLPLIGDWHRDHPRVCGEHTNPLAKLKRPAGSSPRVRGTRDCRFQIRYDDGIIPACAGNTNVFERIAEAFGDHPRVCGEHRAA